MAISISSRNSVINTNLLSSMTKETKYRENNKEENEERGSKKKEKKAKAKE